MKKFITSGPGQNVYVAASQVYSCTTSETLQFRLLKIDGVLTRYAAIRHLGYCK